MASYVDALFLKPAHGDPMNRVPSVAAVAGKGLQGDASFGRKRRQVLLIERETLDSFGLQPGDVRENIVVRGFPLGRLSAGAVVRLGEALLEVTGDCDPCDRMEVLRPGLQAMIQGRRGILAKVVSGGMIRVGEYVEEISRSS